MGRETNIDSIRVLEKQIEEEKGDTIELKRTRNSLLNISTRVPPEILGYIVFTCGLVREVGHVYSWFFEGLQKGSYNFILVCHYWLEVASRTPELWSFWGNTLRDWKKRHDHWAGAAPLDLVLDEYLPAFGTFDKSLEDAVGSRVTRDAIRRVHLVSGSGGTLPYIISSLTPDDEGGQNENIESIVLQKELSPTVDVSNFFARSRLSKLRSLELQGDHLRISSWDHLTSRTTHLTALSLRIHTRSSPPTITTAQLFSILVSNPNLQELLLCDAALPNDADRSTLKVQLRHLKLLSLAGKLCHLLGLLRRLVLPERLDVMELVVDSCSVDDVSRSLAPYMQDYFRRDAGFQDRLGVYNFSQLGFISISVGVIHAQATPPVPGPPQVSLDVYLTVSLDMLEQSFIDLVLALVPLERVVFFRDDLNMGFPEEGFLMMPKIETLYLPSPEFYEGFLQPDLDGLHANENLLPSLRLLCLEDVPPLDSDSWSHLGTFLARRALDNQIISLEVVGRCPNIRPEVPDWIKCLVEEFTYRSRSEAEEYERRY